jgi:ABC-type sugar transport system ATPase subunit
VSIVGQSGAGKTTLVKLLIAEERPNKGNIDIGGWNITKIKSSVVPYLRRQIGVIFQDFRLLAKKTAFENVSFGLKAVQMRVSLLWVTACSNPTTISSSPDGRSATGPGHTTTGHTNSGTIVGASTLSFQLHRQKR